MEESRIPAKAYNLHYAYNVEYFQGLNLFDTRDPENEKRLAVRNKALLQWRTSPPEAPDSFCTHTLELQTAYPGLVLGVGNLHMTGSDEEYSLGFSFDYVTGSPYIPATGIKGLLKSAFQNQDLIRALLNMPQLDVTKLHDLIFEGADACGSPLEIWQRDLFFDAFPREKDQALMADDVLAPHGNDPSQSPNVIKFLKVKPDTVFRFRFRLHDTHLGEDVISAEQKLELFGLLLMVFGTGAKTNVGYGTLVPVK